MKFQLHDCFCPSKKLEAACETLSFVSKIVISWYLAPTVTHLLRTARGVPSLVVLFFLLFKTWTMKSGKNIEVLQSEECMWYLQYKNVNPTPTGVKYHTKENLSTCKFLTFTFLNFRQVLLSTWHCAPFYDVPLQVNSTLITCCQTAEQFGCLDMCFHIMVSDLLT